LYRPELFNLINLSATGCGHLDPLLTILLRLLILPIVEA
jgi:hypothetical protein